MAADVVLVWRDDRLLAPLTRKTAHGYGTDHPLDGWPQCLCTAPGGNTLAGPPQTPGI